MVNLLVSCRTLATLARWKQRVKNMYEAAGIGKTMLEVSKELGVSKDVVKYHQRKMNSNESFKANGKIYITPAGVEKIKNSLKR